MKLTLLGTGTPTPSLKRASSSYLFEIGPDVIVMDHGPGAHNRLLEAGKRVVDVTHVFFSHLHYDHCLARCVDRQHHAGRNFRNRNVAPGHGSGAADARDMALSAGLML